jgi:hypothetical protein
VIATASSTLLVFPFPVVATISLSR